MKESLLTITIFAPLLFAILVAIVPRGQRKLIEWGSLVFSAVVFGLAITLFLSFDAHKASPFQFNQSFAWLPQLGISFSVGLDGVSLLLFTLTTLLVPLVVLASWTQISKLIKEYYVLLFVLETAMLGTFAVTNLVVFFIFWEMMLIPMFFLIGIWGSEQRIFATIKFVLFTAAGSFMMLAAIIYVYLAHHTQFGVWSASFTDLYRLQLPANVQLYLFLAFALAFAIKVPMFPFHTWLPDAHVQAPTAGSVILAGVLLKMGTYGFIRLAMPLFPQALYVCMPYLIMLAVVAIIYGAFVSYVQSDIKKLVAYSSISHMGYVMLGLLMLNQQGVEGAVLQMVNHGISTGGLFLLVGALYQRYHTREIAAYSGMAHSIPKFATVFVIITLSSVGLPLTNGFVGEFLVLLGAFQRAAALYHVEKCLSFFITPVLAASGMIFSALYMLWLVERVFFGKPAEEAAAHAHGEHGGYDLTVAEMIYFAPIVVFIFWIGVYPMYFLNKAALSVAAFVALFNK
jgi:NADH-quinone oxidoreductase subunit M